ncbi:hypothetical protein [Paraburkholderia caffeinilytica]|uniref:Uncharacterized protein n=1 Tax=Paraburkholderia caffeinilytica TaxID=1761016 RepID=A0ABQ1MFV2_9BURK|nr:hypothetical protein [Paraburkholderia caffeinilytica]GGC39510.1 hypothetical protein GCM10011400_27810 [Paraburkholderia caffeinilytica]CAB3786704.1 hypothetical protein LMG28690_02285 [Paraburkholderia caffeinilytica]
MPLHEIDTEKPTKAKNSLVSAYHKEKQKGLGVWIRKGLLKGSDNPDLALLGGHLVVRLYSIEDDEKANEVSGTTHWIFKSSAGHYYGVVVSGPLGES